MRVEILNSPKMVERGRRIIDAMIAAAPVEVVVSQRYTGRGDVLMMYGAGEPERFRWWRQHRAAGGRCIGWDLGYWKRQAEGTCRMRVTIDDDHPQRWLRPEPQQRWESDGIALRHDSDPLGPILVVGMGRKALRAYGIGPQEWERAAVARARKAWPDLEVVYRPKRAAYGGIQRVRLMPAELPIETALHGCSMVVCRHSNVAVDACIAGVPVVCEDGAAAAVYGNDIAQLTVPKVGRAAELPALARLVAMEARRGDAGMDLSTGEAGRPMIRLFCGYDPREAIGFHVFVASVLEHASAPVAITPLDSRGLPQGTNAFTASRFLVPYLCGLQGWAVFADACDMLMLADVCELLEHCNPRKAALVVPNNYKTRHPRKYVGTAMECDNRDYPMKNWASLMLINCQHPAWYGITPAKLRESPRPLLDLLQFRFCEEGDLGYLPEQWNVLADECMPVAGPVPAAKVLHWTAGIPAFPAYRDAPGAQLWHAQRARMECHA